MNTAPRALTEHYLPSAILEHRLLDRRGEFDLWRTVTKRTHLQLEDRVDFHILEEGQWAMTIFREEAARLSFEKLAAREGRHSNDPIPQEVLAVIVGRQGAPFPMSKTEC